MMKLILFVQNNVQTVTYTHTHTHTHTHNTHTHTHTAAYIINFAYEC